MSARMCSSLNETVTLTAYSLLLQSTAQHGCCHKCHLSDYNR